MDDSVIKVLRRNGSWTNSKSVLTNETSKTQASTNADEDFSLDKNFGILAEEIKKRMKLKKEIKDKFPDMEVDLPNYNTCYTLWDNEKEVDTISYYKRNYNGATIDYFLTKNLLFLRYII